VELLTRGYDVLIYDNLSNSNEAVLTSIEKITKRRPEFVKGDLLDRELLESVFSKNKFDAVIHFAGLKAVGESVSEPLKYYKNNVTGTINLLEVMLEHGVKKIVFSSSATVYGTPEKLPIPEDSALSTTNPYGTTKLVLENMLRETANATSGFCAILLRYFNPVGAHESGLIGESPRGIPNNLAPYIIQVAAGKRPFLNVFGDDYETPDGTGVRDYIHVVDLARGHIAALEKIKTSGTHIFNLGTGRGTSVLELLAAFEKAVGKKIPYKVVARRTGDIAVAYADAGKAKRELGWTAKLTIDDMCASMWKFAQNN